MRITLSAIFVLSVFLVVGPVWGGAQVSDRELSQHFGGGDCTGASHAVTCLPSLTQQSSRCCVTVQNVNGPRCASFSTSGYVLAACFHPGVTSDHHSNDYDSCHGGGSGEVFGGCGEYMWSKCIYSHSTICTFTGNSCPSAFDDLRQCNPPSTGFWLYANQDCDFVVN